jgi:hypothetical protein
MSIDYLYELERSIDAGKPVYACPGVAQKHWIISRSVDELRKLARRSAENRKTTVNIVRLVSKHDAISGTLFLVPTGIEEPGNRGEPQIKWSTVETKEAAEMMRDVRFGPAPYFGMEVEETIEPTS